MQHLKYIDWKGILSAQKSYDKRFKVSVTKAVYEQWCTMEKAKLFGSYFIGRREAREKLNPFRTREEQELSVRHA